MLNTANRIIYANKRSETNLVIHQNGDLAVKDDDEKLGCLRDVHVA